MPQPIHLYWGVRAQRDLYLPELPQRWAREHANFTFVPVLSEPDADWRGRSGFVHEAVLEDFPDLSGFDLYMAGPPPMVSAGREACLAAGMPEAHMHFDSFDYADDSGASGVPEQTGVGGQPELGSGCAGAAPCGAGAAGCSSSIGRLTLVLRIS